tara:strand:- start:562 stop:1020 length:459 start_codon:yes stop_codon:yes gene_type:complete
MAQRNENTSRRDFLRTAARSTVGLGAAAAMASPLSGAIAGERQKEAWEIAGEYSKTHPVVAMAVYGRTHDASSEQIAQALGKWFLGQTPSIKTAHVTAKQDRIGASVYFFVKGVAFGPVGIQEVRTQLPTIARLFPQAWNHKQVSLNSNDPS